MGLSRIGIIYYLNWKSCTLTQKMSALMQHNDITEVSIPKILQKAIAVIDIDNIHNALCVNKDIMLSECCCMRLIYTLLQFTINFLCGPDSFSSGNAFVSWAKSLTRFKSRAGQIGHIAANVSPPLAIFFIRSWVTRAQWRGDGQRTCYTHRRETIWVSKI